MNLLKKLITKLYHKFCVRKHKYPPSCIIHRANNTKVVFEIEFNWYDENLSPVSVVRNVKTDKIYSVREMEMLDFVEYTGADPNVGF